MLSGGDEKTELDRVCPFVVLLRRHGSREGREQSPIVPSKAATGRVQCRRDTAELPASKGWAVDRLVRTRPFVLGSVTGVLAPMTAKQPKITADAQ
jgi:hypothetical protein